MNVRDVTKFAARTIIQYGTSKLTTKAVRETFDRFDDNSITPSIVGNITGYVVSEEVGPWSDTFIDKVCDLLKKQPN